MAPPTKDTFEIASPAGESAVAQTSNQTKSASGHLRSDAVSQEVPVRVHGSKVKDTVPGAAPQTEPFEEQTITMIIFPQGAVLKMLTAVNVGQMLVLTNLKSRQDGICRVVKVRPNANMAAYVEVEFTNRQPGYWGLAFSSDSTPSSSPVVPASFVQPPATSESQKLGPEVSWAPAPASTAPVPKTLESSSALIEAKPSDNLSQILNSPAKPAPTFISIGSQEEVQPPAAATDTIKPGTFRESMQENFASFTPKNSAPIEPSSTASTSLSSPAPHGESEGKASGSLTSLDLSAVEARALAEDAVSTDAPDTSRSKFGSFAGGATLAAVRVDSQDQNSAPGTNWVMVAACIGLLIAALGAGLFYWHGHNASKGAVVPAATSPAKPQSGQAELPRVPTSIGLPPMTEAVQPPSASGTANPVPQVNAASAPTATGNPANDSKAAKTPSEVVLPPVPAKKQTAPKVSSNMVSQALNAHPTSAQRTDGGSPEAPSLDSDAASTPPQSSALPDLPSSTNMSELPPPTIQPDGPVKVGGNVKEPRLMSSVMPAYPIGAAQAGVQGDVVIETTIDKSGKVVKMHVLSGPTLLRQAALDALQRWKYEPSTLDGQAVDVQMQVTIKFRR